ncbi:MAG: acyl-CoA dehydrogenase family protein [Novosphingobium sp.]
MVALSRQPLRMTGSSLDPALTNSRCGGFVAGPSVVSEGVAQCWCRYFSRRARIRFDALLDEIRERRSEIEAKQHVPQDIMQALRAVGLYRAAIPECLGGDGSPLADVLHLVEQISEADASVGWVASRPQGAQLSWCSAEAPGWGTRGRTGCRLCRCTIPSSVGRTGR